MTREKDFTTRDLVRLLIIGIAGVAMAAFSYKNPPTLSSAVTTLTGIFVALFAGHWLFTKYFWK